MKDTTLFNIANKFRLMGKIEVIEPYGKGLINKTFLIKTTTSKYILQKINHFVFKKPIELMENVNLVTKHLIKKGSETLNIVTTKDKKIILENNHGFYRCYHLINNTISYDMPNNWFICKEAGRAIGNFQNELADLPINNLHITIPFFHDLKHRYYDLIKVIRNNESEHNLLLIKRYKEVEDDVFMLLSKYDEITSIANLLEKKVIPFRTCHYDTKLNNIIFEKDSNYARCLIDLDTVMPGCSLYDYADGVRGLMSSIKEDEENLANITLNYQYLMCFTIGYLKEASKFLTRTEVSLLINSIKTLVLELAIRFITDYLNNDCYFHIEYEKHNLVRAKAQIALFKEIENKEEYLQKMFDNISKRLLEAF